MARTVSDRQLTARSGIQFAVATPENDAAIRRLLRDNPTPGEISLSFEREPNYFYSAGSDDQTIVAFEQNRLVCMGRCSTRKRFINGQPRRAGYLSELRLDASVQGRFDILRRGYQFFHELQSDAPADFYFTSIAADNARSIRFLERGVAGLPFYKFNSEFVTLLIPTKPGPVEATPTSTEEICAFLCEQGAKGQLACHSPTLAESGLSPDDFQIVRHQSKIVGCAALWDQRTFRQTVIRGYGLKLTLLRPWINAAARIFHTPTLPAVGSTLSYAFVSPLVASDDSMLVSLLDQCRNRAAAAGLDFITVGFAAADSRLAAARRHFRRREYVSRIYQVFWPDLPLTPIVLDDRLLNLEVALL